MTTLILCAQPYAIHATGFYFESYDDFMEQLADAEANGVEEFELQFIDGDEVEASFAALYQPDQANVEQWFDLLDDWEQKNEEERAAIAFLIEDRSITMDSAMEQVESGEAPVMFEGSVNEYIEEYIESTGLLDSMPQELQMYFDSESYGRDMELNGDITTYRYNGTPYVVANASAI